jgi:hypothetical protein
MTIRSCLVFFMKMYWLLFYSCDKQLHLINRGLGLLYGREIHLSGAAGCEYSCVLM